MLLAGLYEPGDLRKLIRLESGDNGLRKDVVETLDVPGSVDIMRAQTNGILYGFNLRGAETGTPSFVPQEIKGQTNLLVVRLRNLGACLAAGIADAS